MNFEKICIIGTGLIGASMALAFKRKNICRELIGVDEQAVIDKAIAKQTGYIKPKSVILRSGKSLRCKIPPLFCVSWLFYYH